MTALGRNVPTDWRHVERFPLAALAADERPTNVPVVLGINWYSAFDTPSKSGGAYWIAHRGSLGHVRGGHCICVEPGFEPGMRAGGLDNAAWWTFYNQGSEGSCVGFGNSRMMSLLNRRRYQAYWLYRASQDLAGIPRSEEGSDVRAALEVLRTQGNVPWLSGQPLEMDDRLIADDKPAAADGIMAYRWATSADEVLDALGTPGADHVTLLNSWGRAYPERVNLPASVLDRLLSEQGEAGVPTDR